MKETTKEVKPSLPLKKENISKNPSRIVMEEKPSVKLIQQQPVQPAKSVREPPFKQLRNESKLRQPSFMAEVKQDLFPCK
jgi:hypothetical protein